MTGVAADDSNCSSSARSRSDKLDSESDDSEPVPPARRRCNRSNCSAEAFIASMASSQEALDKTLFESRAGPAPDGVEGADRAGLADGPAPLELLAGLLKRLRRAGLFFGDGAKRADRAGLRPALFSKLITRALTFVLGSELPASSELEESWRACWMSPVETADEMRLETDKDFPGVPPEPNLLLPGATLFAELMVGLIADGVEPGPRAIDPNDGDFDTPLATVSPLDE